MPLTAEMSNKTLLCMMGLPYSGKTTAARDLDFPTVSPDAIRLAMHGQRFVGVAEPWVWAMAKTMVRSLFLAGHSAVILDATNGTRKRRDEWQSKEWKTVFYPVPASVHLCRERAAGDVEMLQVIDRMHAEWEPLGADEAEARIETLGETGEFPQGRVGPDDEGELKLAVTADQQHKIVRIEFGKSVKWLGLPKDQAFAFAGLITKHANRLA